VSGEFGFELCVCRWAENNWPPGDATADRGPRVVARQLGTERRRWDTIVVECDPEGLRRRAQFGERGLDSDLLAVVRNAPEEWAWYRDALPEPNYPWRYVREAVHRAADRRVIETRRTANRVEIRRRWRYPDWVERVVAVENKPDLDASAARDLREQLEHDVALALADEVWVATRATGERVEPALFEDLPVEAGILALDVGDYNDDGDGDWNGDDGGNPGALTADATVVWYPRSLSVERPGTRILDRPGAGEFDRSGARFEYVDPDEKRRRRLAIAERAYERGWRSYVETMRPDCRQFGLANRDGALVPMCDAKGRGQSARECAGSCPSFEPEPPGWRQRGPPIEGGPGALQRRLLRRRRERRRPDPDAMDVDGTGDRG
jgi:hypothetical protein